MPAITRSPARLTAHIDVAVVGVAHEAMAALLQFLVQHVQHQVRQQRRERAALRRAFLRRADQPSFHHPRGQKAADQLQDALVSNPLGHQPHQDVVVDPVEELLQVDVHDKAVAGRDVRLRLRHRLMRRAPRPEAEARLGERPVPVRLQHLQHRLLDEAVEHRRDAERPQCRPMPSVSRRAVPAAACKCLRAVGPGSWASAPSGRSADHRHSCRRSPAAPLLRFTRANAFFRFSRSTTASIDGPAAAGRSRLAFAARASVPWAAALRGFTPRSGAQAQLDLILLPHGSREITALLASSTVRAFGGALPPTMPSADFCAAVRPPCDDLSLVAETQRRPPEVRPTAFAARPPDLPPRPLMTVDFAIICSLVRPGRPRYPVLVHRAAALLRASFRPHLAMTPLRFANPSPPSGWIEDFHLQAVDHARHTANGSARMRGPMTGSAKQSMLPQRRDGLLRSSRSSQ